MNKYEKFALNHHLSEYPAADENGQAYSFNDVLELIEDYDYWDNPNGVVICERYEGDTTMTIIELIENMAEELQTL